MLCYAMFYADHTLLPLYIYLYLYLSIPIPISIYTYTYIYLPQSNTQQLLARMAHLLGSGGAVKPCSAFSLTGRRLLELVYKTAPQVCGVVLSVVLE
jgi:hypothetical protein